jgi:hypothetical protein
MLRTLTWLFRAGGAVLIGVATFGYSAASGRDLVIEAVAFAIGAVVVAYWLAADLRPEFRQPRVLAGALVVMAAASGFASPRDRGGNRAGRVRDHRLVGLHRRQGLEDRGCFSVTGGTGRVHGQGRCGFHGHGTASRSLS